MTKEEKQLVLLYEEAIEKDFEGTIKAIRYYEELHNKKGFFNKVVMEINYAKDLFFDTNDKLKK